MRTSLRDRHVLRRDELHLGRARVSAPGNYRSRELERSAPRAPPGDRTVHGPWDIRIFREGERMRFGTVRKRRDLHPRHSIVLLQCTPSWSGENCNADVNECEVDNGGCHPERECINADGGSICAETCTEGFEPVGDKGCRDIDECSIPNFRINYPDFVDIDGNTCDDYTQVPNQEGSVLCSFAAGLPMVDDPSRTALTECAVCGGGRRPCSGRGEDVHASSCSNTVGSFTCDSCDAGYTGDGDNGCNDVNECSAGTDNCSANAACTNTPGSFSCACNMGYSGNGVTCNDINECALGTDACDTNATCTNNSVSRTSMPAAPPIEI